MDDTIYRQAAIDAIEALWDDAPTAQHVSAMFDCEDAIRELPSAQETHEKRTETHTCDLISRQKALASHMRMYDAKTGVEWIPVFWIKDLPSAQPEQRWIPCSERLPEYDKPVLLSTAWGKTEIGFWTQRGWMIVACSYREFEQGAVAAWMPLPEPYKGEQDG